MTEILTMNEARQKELIIREQRHILRFQIPHTHARWIMLHRRQHQAEQFIALQAGLPSAQKLLNILQEQNQRLFSQMKEIAVELRSIIDGVNSLCEFDLSRWHWEDILPLRVWAEFLDRTDEVWERAGMNGEHDNWGVVSRG